jgi:hypothetical protein
VAWGTSHHPGSRNGIAPDCLSPRVISLSPLPPAPSSTAPAYEGALAARGVRFVACAHVALGKDGTSHRDLRDALLVAEGAGVEALDRLIVVEVATFYLTARLVGTPFTRLHHSTIPTHYQPTQCNAWRKSTTNAQAPPMPQTRSS